LRVAVAAAARALFFVSHIWELENCSLCASPSLLLRAR
jgi:hypothetical protein